MADVKWIKLSTDIFDDEKIDFIQSLPEGDSLEIIWIRLLTMAGKCNESGYIFLTENIPYTEEALAYKFRKPVNIVKLALQTFQNLNMIEINDKGIQLINWSKHQSLGGLDKIKEKEQARLRKQKQRERENRIEEPCMDEVADKTVVEKGAETEMSQASHSSILRDSHSMVTGDPSIIELDRELDKELELKKELDRDSGREKENGDSLSSYQSIMDNYNKMCKTLPKATILDDTRISLIKNSLSKVGGSAAFITVFKKAQESDFLSGRNERWQGCTFDWLITESNMIKTLEGNYDNRKTGGKQQEHSFNDYDQRQYDYDDLEKKLLGWDQGG